MKSTYPEISLMLIHLIRGRFFSTRVTSLFDFKPTNSYSLGTNSQEQLGYAVVRRKLFVCRSLNLLVNHFTNDQLPLYLFSFLALILGCTTFFACHQKSILSTFDDKLSRLQKASFVPPQMARDSSYQYIIGLTHAVHFLNEYVRRIHESELSQFK